MTLLKHAPIAPGTKRSPVKLLTQSHANFTLGDLFGEINKTSYDHRNDNVINYFTFSDNALREALRQQLRAVPLVAGSLPRVEITESLKSGFGASLGFLPASLTAKFGRDKLIQAHFSGVEVRVLDAALRIELTNGCRELRKQNPRLFRRNVGPFFMADNLYYATEVSMLFERKVSIEAEVEAELKAADATASLSLEGEHKIRLDYGNDKSCPFAVELIDPSKF